MNDGSNYDLETSASIDYESLAGSKDITITITVTDDNPDQKTSDFDVVIEITNVNESPFWTNANGAFVQNGDSFTFVISITTSKSLVF